MDEQRLADLFHEAYDVQPRPGAFDRLRTVLAGMSSSARPRKAIGLPMPTVNRAMLAAALIVVTVVAAFGGFLLVYRATHHEIPAGYRGTIVIGGDDATSGADAKSGVPIQLGEEFAVARAGSVRGFALRFAAYDDSENGVHDATRGAQNVQDMIANPHLLAMIGPFDSATAAAEIKVANPASLAIISPGNTERCLTVDVACAANGWWTPAKLRPSGPNNYFRIAANDTVQGPAMADFAFDSLGLRVIAAWDDGDDIGKLMADGFATEFTRKGGRIVARQTFDIQTSTAPDFRPWLRAAKAAGAQAIYAGAAGPYGCVPRAQSAGIFAGSSYYLGPGNLINAIGLGGGIADSECISEAGDMANDHMYAMFGIGAAELNPVALPIIAAYEAANPDPASMNRGTFAGYDCATILIDAIGRAIDANGGNMPSRQQVLEQLAATRDFHGLTGTFTFDAAGDVTTPSLQVVREGGGVWTPVTNVVATNSPAT